MKDYFTANQGRKIFFWGLFAMTVALLMQGGILLAKLPVTDYETREFLEACAKFLRYVIIIALLFVSVGTMWDSMQSNYYFRKKVAEMQYNHLKEVYEKQEAGENVVMTPAFNDDEKKYLRRKKWWFVLVIIFKAFLVIALFSLLLAV